jgi:hypothetical protein
MKGGSPPVKESHIPSLCHPLFSASARTDYGLPVPAFPEIRSDVYGVCLSHLNWIDLNSPCCMKKEAIGFSVGRC